MMTDTRIYLIRHGEVDNPHKVFYGRLPRFKLTARGMAQAEQTARYLASSGLAAIYSSPLLRARQTAAAIARRYPGFRVHLSQWLNEVHTGCEGMPGIVLDARKGDIYTDAGAGFEKPEDIMRRLRRFFDRTLRKFPRQRVAAVTHGDVITFAMIWAKDGELSPVNKTRLQRLGYSTPYPAHASVVTFSFESLSVNQKPWASYEQPWS